MKRHAWLALAAVVSVLAFSLTMAAASASTTARKARATAPVPSVKVINLHSAYQKALPLVHHGPVKILPLAGKKETGRPAAKAAPKSPCTEPNCDLPYNGGPVQHSPHVYLLFWGPVLGADLSYLTSFYAGLGVQPQDDWSTITSQYGDGSGHPAFSGTVYEGAWQDTTVPPASVTQNDLNAEADALTSYLSIADKADAQVVVASQSGTCFADGFAGNPGSCASSPPAYCAWHTSSAAGEAFTNLPYQLDAGAGCGENFVNSGSAGTYDGFSIVGGHEYAESVTDPAPDSGWIDTADTISGGEVADKCVWGGELWGSSDPAGDVTLSTGSYAMQSLWSNSAGGCVLSGSGGPPPPPPPAVTSVVPSSGPAAGGTAVTVNGTGLTGGTVRFGASAATAVTCAASDCHVTAPAGTGTVDVRVTTGAGTSPVTAADHYSYIVSPPPPVDGPITSRLPGPLCADNWHGLNVIGNKIDIYTCNGTRAQVWEPKSGLIILKPGTGKCMDVKFGGTANGTPVWLWPCNGTPAQIWRYDAVSMHLTSPHASGKCLTAPSAVRGTQLVIRSCSGTAPGQKWTLP